MNKYMISPTWEKILAIIVAVLALYLGLRMICNNPQAFSRDSIGKSFFTMGILALVLIGFIGLCVWYLRHAT